MNRSAQIRLFLSVLTIVVSMQLEVCAQDTSLQELLAKFENLPESEKIQNQSDLADSLHLKSRYTESLKVIEHLMANPQLESYDSLHCKVMFTKGQNHLFLSDLDSAIYWLKKSIHKCEKCELFLVVGKSKLRLGNSYNQLGAFDTAMIYFQEAKAIFSELDDQKSLASLNNSIALLYSDTDRPLKSLEYLLKTLSYFDSIDDAFNLSVIQNNIGLLYANQQDTSNAFRYYYESVRNAKRTDYDVQLAKTYTNLGNLHSNTGDKDSTFFYFQKSLEISQKTGSKYSLANIHYNLGEVFTELGKADSAEYHIKKSKELCEMLNIYEGLFYCNLGLGNISKLRNEYNQAIGHYLEAYQLASGFGIQNLKKTAAENLHQAYMKVNDFENALRYFTEYHAIKDSLASVEKETEFKELTIKYETKLKEEENNRLKDSNQRNEAMLAQQNTYLLILFVIVLIMIALIFILLSLNDKYKRTNLALDEQRKDVDLKNAQLEKVNQELKEVISIKDKLMSVISHDLRSPMASLQGLIALLQSDSLSREEFAQIIRKIETNLLNFSKFSDNILQWVKGQSHGIAIKKEKIALCELIDDALKLHDRQIELKEIRCEINCIPGEDAVIADNQTISIVLRNLISNAIKFSPIGGSIELKLTRASEGMICSVRDSGYGMNQELIDKIHERKPIMPSAGTSNEKGLGLGLSLCLEFLSLNDSQLIIQSEGGKGTTFSFLLPAADVEAKA